MATPSPTPRQRLPDRRACFPAEWRLARPGDLVAALLCTPDDVAAGIECGLIPFVVDLRSPGARRPDPRIWRPVVERLIDSGGSNAGMIPSMSALLGLIVPPREVSLSELVVLWACSQEHLRSLIHDGALASERPPGAPIAGPRSGWRMSPAAVRAFLEGRIVGLEDVGRSRRPGGGAGGPFSANSSLWQPAFSAGRVMIAGGRPAGLSGPSRAPAEQPQGSGGEAAGPRLAAGGAHGGVQ